MYTYPINGVGSCTSPLSSTLIKFLVATQSNFDTKPKRPQSVCEATKQSKPVQLGANFEGVAHTHTDTHTCKVANNNFHYEYFRAGQGGQQEERKDKVLHKVQSTSEEDAGVATKVLDCKATEHDTLTLILGMAFANSGNPLPLRTGPKKKGRQSPLCLRFVCNSNAIKLAQATANNEGDFGQP